MQKAGSSRHDPAAFFAAAHPRRGRTATDRPIPKNRHENGQKHAENNLPRQRNYRRHRRLAECLQIDKRPLVYGRKNHHAQVNAEAFYRKIRKLTGVKPRRPSASLFGIFRPFRIDPRQLTLSVSRKEFDFCFIGTTSFYGFELFCEIRKINLTRNVNCSRLRKKITRSFSDATGITPLSYTLFVYFVFSF